jgi:hypothetical protein
VLDRVDIGGPVPAHPGQHVVVGHIGRRFAHPPIMTVPQRARFAARRICGLDGRSS